MRSHEQSRNHPDATTTAKGFTQLNSSVTDDSEAQAATPKAVKIAMDNASARLAKDRNLADLPNPALARQNLQLGDSSTKNTGTTANTVAAGDDARIAGAMQKNQNGADIPDVAKFLQNLRLGAGAPAIGIPFFWPSVAMPNTVMDEWSDMVFLKFNGATFSATTYPKLALVIPSLKLTDARGAFPRILDDGRGVDNGRVLLSEQLDAMQNVTGSLSDNTMGSAYSASGVFRVDSGSGVKYAAPSAGNAFGYYGMTFDLSRSGRTSEETRPRNIAFNFLVRAK
ncbi:tail fiber protein, partial [Citrobacter freundii]